MTRREYREQVFKYIYSQQFFDDEETNDQVDLLMESGTTQTVDDEDNEIAFSESDMEEIRAKVSEIMTAIPEIDEKLSAASEGWKLSRMSKVDLAILRLATYELLYDHLPEGVAIGEAVELAKKYGTDRSGSFVNGIMAKLV
jgi:N utilization substance protein B